MFDICIAKYIIQSYCQYGGISVVCIAELVPIQVNIKVGICVFNILASLICMVKNVKYNPNFNIVFI